MHKRWLIIAAFALIIFVVADVGCNSSSSPIIQVTPTPVTTVTPLSAATTVPLAANTALPIPPIAGYSGTFKETGGVPLGASVTLTSYISGPKDAPQPLALAHSSSTSSGPNVGHGLFIVRQQYSMPLTLASFPSSTWHIPAGVSGGPFELETIDATTGLLLDTESQTSFTGGVVSFPGNTTPFPVLGGHTYWWELITGFPSPAPSGCGLDSLSASINTVGQTLSAPDICNFHGTVTISANNAPSGANINVSNNVPALSGSQGPAAPSGTTTGVISIAVQVDQTVTFNSGFMQLATRLPSTIPAGGKSFFASACTIHSHRFGTGSMIWDGCSDTTVFSGLLAVSGQTISFPGVSSSLTLTASHGFITDAGIVDPDRCFKHCTIAPRYDYYFYTVSIYY